MPTNKLNSFISFGKSFSTLSTIAQLAVVCAMVFVAFTMGNCKGSDKLDKFIVEYKEYQRVVGTTLTASEALKNEVATLKTESTEKDSTIRELKISVSFNNQKRNTLRNDLSSLEAQLIAAKNDTNTVAIIHAQDGIIINLKEQVVIADESLVKKDSIIQFMDYKVSKLDSALTLSELRADSLHNVLTKLPPAPSNPNKFLGIKLPSRKMVGAISFLAGVAIGHSGKN